MSDKAISFEACAKDKEHARLIMNWRNDPVTLKMFYHHTPKVWPDFWEEYKTHYLVLTPRPVFAVYNGEKVGFVKFDSLPATYPNKIGVSISINVAPNFRSGGLGTDILTAISNYLSTLGIHYIEAEVRAENFASARAFEKATYQLQGEAVVRINDTGEDARVFKYLKQLNR